MDRIRYDLIRPPGQDTVNIDVIAFLFGDHRSAMESHQTQRIISVAQSVNRTSTSPIYICLCLRGEEIISSNIWDGQLLERNLKLRADGSHSTDRTMMAVSILDYRDHAIAIMM